MPTSAAVFAETPSKPRRLTSAAPTTGQPAQKRQIACNFAAPCLNGKVTAHGFAQRQTRKELKNRLGWRLQSGNLVLSLLCVLNG